jgi:N-sulfoglucosamine sulfohydrolase
MDIFPTVLDTLGIEIPAGIDGISLLPLLRGQNWQGRDYLMTYFLGSGIWGSPMVAITDGEYGYIYNGWSDGQRRLRGHANSGPTLRAMENSTNPEVMSRAAFAEFRVKEELYDYRRDENALNNLFVDEQYADVLRRLREALFDETRESSFPMRDGLCEHFRLQSSAADICDIAQ